MASDRAFTRAKRSTSFAVYATTVALPVVPDEACARTTWWRGTGRDRENGRGLLPGRGGNWAEAAAEGNTDGPLAGTASLVRDRKRIDALWSPSMGRFFPGGKDDPDLCLIRVNAESAEYWDGPGEMLGQALHFVLSAVTDDPASLTENERLDLRR